MAVIAFERKQDVAADQAARPRLSVVRPTRRQLGQILIEQGAVRPADLVQALALRRRQTVRLGDILLARGWVHEDALMRALATQWGCGTVDLTRDPPQDWLTDLLGADFCLTHAVIPWRRHGDDLILATARPEDFGALKARLPRLPGRVDMVIASENAIHAALLAHRQEGLIRQAETRVDAADSARSLDGQRLSALVLLMLVALTAGLTFAPLAVFGLIAAWATLTLIATTGLKALAFAAEVRGQARDSLRSPPAAPGLIPLPVISVMVPMFNEPDIAPRLVARLSAVDYPRELLDVMLVVEEVDTTTRDALSIAGLPHWMRVVTVPDGPVRTKPRALNYALNFAKGSVIGVWDAEDRPEPSQLRQIAAHFARAGDDVACLQGRLDYYNPRVNWLSRCFTIEYAAWFRAMLPGVARLGLVIPLGGTTLFFRRTALEELGGWDAHNVTEDADLGVRLARHGWRTELADTTTHEEANCRTLPWVKQRSRWLKGYAMTWAVHMRDPLRLWRDLGPRRFLSFQIQLLGTLSQYLLAPVLWTFWLASFGLWHPVATPLADLVGPSAVTALFTLFLATEALNLLVNLWATRGADHRGLWGWTLTMNLYFPLGALAGWKAIHEVLTKPFYWDKTAHGLYDGAAHEVPPTPGPALAPQPALAAVQHRGTIS
ncbi:glycosyltransferase family 2 protein [Paracoccus sp. p4-l81]|uniref:glycosyltransferase family 2 protein n=1 Tax=Paracoccus sp. p4-l81 TaxID=3342806 RepID=UPI0035B9AB20